MNLGWNLPAPASKQELLEVLDDMRARIEADDSWEGTFTYVMPTDEPWLNRPCEQCKGSGENDTKTGPCDAPRCWQGEVGEPFGVLARYRVGNAEHGQGFLRVFERPWPEGMQEMEQFTERWPREIKGMLKAIETAMEDGSANRSYLTAEYVAAIAALRWALGINDNVFGLQPELPHDR